MEIGKQKNVKTILFVCIENSGRSQMAEAFFRTCAPGSYEAVSAGTRPASQMNPVVVEAMMEIGIDMTRQKPKTLTNEMIQKSALSVNMGCMDRNECPALSMKNFIDWNIEDPKNKPMEKVREIRDDIKLKVDSLCKTLE